MIPSALSYIGIESSGYSGKSARGMLKATEAQVPEYLFRKIKPTPDDEFCAQLHSLIECCTLVPLL
jgi:hypothetical protein